MRFYSEQLTVHTVQPIQLLDVTKEVTAIIARSKGQNGLTVVAPHHTTTAIRINDPSARLADDLLAFFEKLTPRSDVYQHNINSTDGRFNAHSHLLAWLMGASENIPV